MSELKNGKMQALSLDDLDQVSGGVTNQTHWDTWSQAEKDKELQEIVDDLNSQNLVYQDKLVKLNKVFDSMNYQGNRQSWIDKIKN